MRWLLCANSQLRPDVLASSLLKMLSEPPLLHVSNLALPLRAGRMECAQHTNPGFRTVDDQVQCQAAGHQHRHKQNWGMKLCGSGQKSPLTWLRPVQERTSP